MHLRIETTTNTTVFNSIGPRCKWFSNQLGQRPIEKLNASYPTLMELVSQNKNIRSIALYSEFGDALEWPHANSFMKVCTIAGKHVTADTFGMGKHSGYIELRKLMERLNWHGINVRFHICGICEQSGKVFLNADWKIIKRNILALGKFATIRFYLFKHNAYQLNAIKNFCNAIGANLEIVHDPCNGHEFECVSTPDGKWMYDVHHVDSAYPTLVKTVQGWHRLKHYAVKQTGQGIDQAKNIAQPAKSSSLDNDNMISITVKGHVIKGSQQSSIFSNALCNDWNQQSFDLSNEYNKSTLRTLSDFSKRNLDSVNIYRRKSFRTILEKV